MQHRLRSWICAFFRGAHIDITLRPSSVLQRWPSRGPQLARAAMIVLKVSIPRSDNDLGAVNVKHLSRALT